MGTGKISEDKIPEANISETERFVQKLLNVLPAWHSKLVRPLKDGLKREMSLETYYCLETLKMCGPVTMTEMSRQLKVPKQQVTILVDKLSSHNFVKREYRDGDRRAVWIGLTPEAVDYLDGYYRKNRTFIRSLEEQLTKEELEKLAQAVGILGEILPKLK